MWRLHEQHAFAVVYRSPFAITFEGDARITGTPLGNVGPSRMEARIEFPQMVTLAYAFRPTDKLKLEVDFQWFNWDTLNDVRLRSPDPTFNGQALEYDWKDSVLIDAGGEYRLNDRWAVRAGYSFIENSIPSRTFSPSLPDSDQHVLAAGAAWTGKRLQLALAYQYSLFTKRRIQNNVASPVVDGRYESDAHALTLTSRWRF